MEAEAELVSIVIPTYNHAEYIGRTIDSILKQTYDQWEIIVVDNNSKDATERIVKGFKHGKIKYLKINNKGSIAASRNMAIRNANGKWIAFLDSDDWWTPTKLERSMKCRTPTIDLVYHDMFLEGRSGPFGARKKMRSRQVQSPVIIDLLVSGNVIYNSTVLVRKDLLLSVDGISESAELIGSEDYHTWLKIAERTEKFLHVPELLSAYTVHENNISKKNIYGSWMCAISSFRLLLTDRQNNSIDARARYLNARYNYTHGNYKDAESEFKYCLKGCNFAVRVKSHISLIQIRLKLFWKFVI